MSFHLVNLLVNFLITKFLSPKVLIMLKHLPVLGAHSFNNVLLFLYLIIYLSEVYLIIIKLNCFVHKTIY